MMNSMEQVIKKFFSKKREVVAVYLFGSVVKKSKKNPEDIDIAALYLDKKAPDFREQLDIKENLVALLKKEVDLVILNRANPILTHQILRDGKQLLNNNPSLVNHFFVRSLNAYDDIKRVRAPIENAILKRRVYG